MRKILWKLGLTSEERTELSDLLYDTSTANKLPRVEDNSLLFAGVSLDVYPIILKGQDLTFLVDNPELYNTIENGQTFEVAYRKRLIIPSTTITHLTLIINKYLNLIFLNIALPQ